jgi:hypothetical protein
VGCSSETGLIFDVTREAGDGATRDVSELVLHVGFNLEADDRILVDNPDDEQASVDVSDRDLSSDPYSLLVKPGDLGDRTYDAAGVQVVVLGLKNGQVLGAAWLEQPVHFSDEEVRRYELVLKGDVVVDDGGPCTVVVDGPKVAHPEDQDCDGDKNPEAGGKDCDDLDATVGPRQPELCDNGLDDNCNGKVDFEDNEDLDGDSYVACAEDPAERDCFETGEESLIAEAAAVNPGATEVCDGYDNNCDGMCDRIPEAGEQSFDFDLDGVTTCGSLVDEGGACEAGPDDSRIDCNDFEKIVNFREEEVCDGFDNDCNGGCDDLEDADKDGDYFTTCDSRWYADGKPGGKCEVAVGDCDDERAHINPDAPEVCDGFDSDCNPATDAETAKCFHKEVDRCYVGRALCDDANDEAPIGDACIGDQSAPVQYCAAYDSCLDHEDVEGCTSYAVEAEVVSCTIAVFQEEGGQTAVCHGGASIALPADVNNVCTWFVAMWTLWQHREPTCRRSGALIPIQSCV